MINGRRPRRAVDQHGFVVNILVQSRRDQHAAEAFIRRAVGGWDYTPRVVIIDKRQLSTGRAARAARH